MAKMPKEVLDAVANEGVLKCLATINPTGVLNAVVVGTITALNEETIAFCDLKLGKTKDNLQQTKNFTVTVFTPQMQSYQLKCVFQEFQETGPLAEQFNEAVWSKIKMQIRAVGIGKVEEIYSASLNNPGVKIA
ncbi:MAG: hypothetical protein STSR0004_21530 [Peptococcaceae bacterium]